MITQTAYRFHPAVSRWFERRFDHATTPQERGWPQIQAGRHTLIAAPTGSGKTLAAFLASLDRLFTQALAGDLDRETRILYVSPLKALSNDIHRNLAEPLKGIRAEMEAMGYGQVHVTTAVRTGDTTSSQRQAIVRNPPHILVTTPESMYLMLTSESGRRTLAGVDTLIVDEIHALADNRRGAHLALSIERLENLVDGPLQRIGLSATQRPMDTVARFLVGNRNLTPEGKPDCAVVDEGHMKELDLALEMPGSPLEAVMSHEVWEDIYHRLAELAQTHKTTLIFANTRRVAERVTYHLATLMGSEHVASHHGSLSLDIRHATEARLKSGDLKVVVATASLELGIDIGYVDLVCQIGTPRTISMFLQRVGRSGHYYGGVPKGRLFPLTRDELVDCCALLRCVHRGELDKLVIQNAPLDVLSQQLVAESACDEYDVDHLYGMFKNAWLYRNLPRKDFDDLVHMLADGFTTKNGRTGALLYHDGVNGKVKGRKSARLTALTNGGAIPDNADYRVVMEPTGMFVGTLNEDFAVESIPGDVFQLGNNSWRIAKIETGVVRVEDAHGQPPTIPFWFGEAPSRSAELSLAVSHLREDIASRLDNIPKLLSWLTEEEGVLPAAAEQLVAYLHTAHKALGALPSQNHLILERFFDEAGGMQLVIHAPFGSRINRAWGLALRKRFCRSFNFELQAAANEDAIVLSLGPKHSFPLDDVYRFLHHETARDVLVQALLDAPMFQTRWRWNAGRALALRRQSGGRRIPPAIQRMQAEDLIAVVFPDQLACLENIAGDREVPDHPLVAQTITDCLEEAMDLPGLESLLQRIEGNQLKMSALDLPEPSVLCHEILNAKPYAFLDDAPLEERRTQAVYLRRTLDIETIRSQGLLDQEAVVTVREQAWPAAETEDEVHEALLLLAALRPQQAEALGSSWLNAIAELEKAGRVGLLKLPGERGQLLITAERLPLWLAVFPAATVKPKLKPPAREAGQDWEAESARIELCRARLEICGPTTAAQLAGWLGLTTEEADITLLSLEAEGSVLRGYFDKELDRGGEKSETQWCNRRLLARIHHLTIKGLRAAIRPVAAGDYLRFLFRWQHVGGEHKVREESGLEGVIELLEGFESAAISWEGDLLPARVKNYQTIWLDRLCLTGAVGWGRLNPPDNARGGGPIKTSPLSLFFHENADVWQAAAGNEPKLSGYARCVREVLEDKGALFFTQLKQEAGLLHTQMEIALGELTALGMVTADSFTGLRALLVPSDKRPTPRRGSMRRRADMVPDLVSAGRWSLLPRGNGGRTEETAALEEELLEYRARVLLRRWGVVFRRLLERESNPPPWRELLRVYRRLEAIGEIRGGYFVAGVGGEQYALPEAVGALRKARDKNPEDSLISLSACDPLNLAGIILPGRRVPQTPNNRVLFKNGEAIAALIAGEVVDLVPQHGYSKHELETALHNRENRATRLEGGGVIRAVRQRLSAK
ncbi:MAG: DEAD/DEAH box helicase [Acidobacteriota bacterium]|nr:DEAD/DEAH box helicase [Acidobacteriota bacterium]